MFCKNKTLKELKTLKQTVEVIKTEKNKGIGYLIKDNGTTFTPRAIHISPMILRSHTPDNPLDRTSYSYQKLIKWIESDSD